jgi:hypothetical protein
MLKKCILTACVVLIFACKQRVSPGHSTPQKPEAVKTTTAVKPQTKAQAALPMQPYYSAKGTEPGWYIEMILVNKEEVFAKLTADYGNSKMKGILKKTATPDKAKTGCGEMWYGDLMDSLKTYRVRLCIISQKCVSMDEVTHTSLAELTVEGRDPYKGCGDFLKE